MFGLFLGLTKFLKDVENLAKRLEWKKHRGEGRQGVFFLGRDP